MSSLSDDPEQAGLRRWAQLGCALILVVGIWLGLLPRIAKNSAVQAYLQWLDQKKIDPSAMYYTELEAMEPILERLERDGH